MCPVSHVWAVTLSTVEDTLRCYNLVSGVGCPTTRGLSRVIVMRKMLLQSPHSIFESAFTHHPAMLHHQLTWTYSSSDLNFMWNGYNKRIMRYRTTTTVGWWSISSCITVGARNVYWLWSHNSESETPVFPERSKLQTWKQQSGEELVQYAVALWMLADKAYSGWTAEQRREILWNHFIKG